MGKLQGSSLDRRFFHRLGASLLDRTICATAGAAGCDDDPGHPGRHRSRGGACNRRYIINWGSNTSVTNMHLWAIMHQARKDGARIVTIDPFRCKTAERSDWWLPIRPGTDAALALGMMHVLWRDGLQDDDYLQPLLPRRRAAARSASWTSMRRPKSPHITGVPADGHRATGPRIRHDQAGLDSPELRHAAARRRRHGGAHDLLSARRHRRLAADRRRGLAQHQQDCIPSTAAPLERPDLIPPGTRTINMVQLAEALNGELPGPPVRALYVYNANPAAVCPDQGRVLQGLRREDLFTVVHEQFPTDTADYADIVLPATTQLEHFDIHGSYGHLYVQINEPAIAPLAEAKSNTDVFRLLARAMGFEPELFEVSDRATGRARLWATSGVWPCFRRGAPSSASRLERLRREGPIRLNRAEKLRSLRRGRISARPRASANSTAPRWPQGAWTRCRPTFRRTRTRRPTRSWPRRYPLQMITPPVPAFSELDLRQRRFAAAEGRRADRRNPLPGRGPRAIEDGQTVRVFNERGSFQARAVVGDSVKPGVVVSQGIWWNKYTADKVNCNTTTSTQLTDLGGGSDVFRQSGRGGTGDRLAATR